MGSSTDNKVSCIWKSLIALSFLGTNFVALYSLTISRQLTDVPGFDLVHLHLASIRNDLLNHLKQQQQRLEERFDFDLSLSPELRMYTEVREFPLGRHGIFGISQMASSVGHACRRSPGLLRNFTSYTAGELCPDDSDIAHELLVRGCEPLPRRRCLARTPSLPLSLWTLPPEDAVTWSHNTCRSFACLEGQRSRNVNPGRHEIAIEEVLRTNRGTIRVGLDLGGGTGSFAARMWQMNVTIVTATVDFGGSLVSARGLVPMHVTLATRLPFFDNTLDLVHSLDLLGSWIPLVTFEFLLYDIDRILRPRGLLWIVRFTCTVHELHHVYGPVIERMGYRTVRWVVDNRDAEEVHLTALLEKPIRG